VPLITLIERHNLYAPVCISPDSSETERFLIRGKERIRKEFVAVERALSNISNVLLNGTWQNICWKGIVF
jgi:hypothetical protein